MEDRWDEEQIRKTAKIMLKAERKRGMLIQTLDSIVHWLLLLLIVLGSVIMGGFFVFLSALVRIAFMYIIVGVIGYSMGSFVESVLRDIEKLDEQKHKLTKLLLPFFAAVNIPILYGIKNSIEVFSQITFNFNPLYVGIVYGIFLVLPHYIGRIRK